MKSLGALLILVLAAAPLSAEPFASVITDARAAALGGTHTGMGADPGAAIANPALLPLLGHAGGQFLLRDWYGSGARSSVVGWAQPWRSGGLTLAWHRFGQSDLYNEDCLSLGLGLRLPTPGPAALVGIQLKGLQISVPGYTGADYAGDARAPALDATLHLSLRSDLQFCWMEENLYAGEMQLLDGGDVWRAAPRSSRQSLRYLWREDLALILEHWGRPGRDTTLLFGAELRFYGAFHVRAGSGLNSATAGFGLRADRWRADFAFESRGRLGNCLTFSFSPLLATGEGR